MSSLLNFKTLGIACGAGFLAYCIYFDNKRRNAPDYKQKVRERREEDRKAREKREEIELPSLDDKQACEQFFVRQLEIGDELIHAGDTDRAAIHMSHAVAFCPQPEQFLKYLRGALPQGTYEQIIDGLVPINKRLTEARDRLRPQAEDVE